VLQELADAAYGVVADRSVILTNFPTAVLAREAAVLVAHGARQAFILGVGGSEDDAPGFASFALRPPDAADLFNQLHGQDRLLETIPDAAVRALAAFDPAHEAAVLAGSWTTLEQVAGRRVLGHRRAEWAALEDKTVSDELLVAAGVEPMPSTVVAADERALAAAAQAMDLGDGTVWAGDATGGVNGNGDLVRYAAPGTRGSELATFFAQRCKRVRVAPFVAGVPASIHGLVFPGGTVVFRPLEVLSLRCADGTFFNAGTASVWRPAAGFESQMRDAARAVGELLCERYGYRGAFGVDGIAAGDTFAITEINPRLSGGFSTLGASLPELPFRIVDVALREQVTLPDPVRVEEAALAVLERSTGVVGACSLSAGGGFTEEAEHEVRPGITVHTGPSPRTGYVAVSLEPGSYEEGAPVAPLIAEILTLADERFGTHIGEVRAAWD
jgi:hypothetical protein